MEKDLVNIISEKTYLELSNEEMAEVREYCSNEGEYNQMREVFIAMEKIKVPVEQPRKETKDRLDALFNDTYPKSTPVWYMSVLATVVPKDKSFIQQPLLKVAALVVLLLMVYPFMQSDSMVEQEKQQLAQLEMNESDEQGSLLPEKVEEFVMKSKDNTNGQSVITDQDNLSQTFEPLTEDFAESSAMFDAEGSGAVDNLSAPPVIGGFSLAEVGSDHPDGIYDETISVPSKSVSADRNPEILDLLTATF